MSDDDADLIDQHVGRMIRLLRKKQRLSQTVLAEALGVSFQQIQKYERGANRISASKLYQTAALLGVPVAALYDGLPTLADANLALDVDQAARRRLLAALSEEGAAC